MRTKGGKQDALRKAKALAAFKRARDRLHAQYGERGGAQALYPLFSAATFSRLLRGESHYPAESISPVTRDRLVWFFDREDRAVAAAFGLKELMEQSDLDRRVIAEEFAGTYCLFRHHSSVGHVGLEIVESRLHIVIDADGASRFLLWGHDWSKEAPERSGRVLHRAGKLFLLGSNGEELNLTILMAGARSGPMQGLTLSTTGRLTSTPYAARVIVVREGDEALLGKLRSYEGLQTFGELIEPESTQFMRAG